MKYIHYRFMSDGQPKPKGGVTFAYDTDEGHVFYAVARCSPKDTYNKKLGRSIATGRWDKAMDRGTIAGFVMVGEQSRRSLEAQIIAHYADKP